MYYEAFDLIVSVIDKRFNKESLSSLLMVTTMIQSFLKHRTAKMLILGRYTVSYGVLESDVEEGGDILFQ